MLDYKLEFNLKTKTYIKYITQYKSRTTSVKDILYICCFKTRL